MVLMKPIVGVLAAQSLLLGLGGCALFGPSEEELRLQADCSTVFDNAATTYDWAEDVEMEFWNDKYAAMNAGMVTS